MTLQIQSPNSLHAIDAQQWDAITDATPLLCHRFLSALETHGCVGEQAGWIPSPLVVTENERLLGALPLYLKYHSYGEYVFDWSWAEAYQQHGLNYYPKLLCAVPFTPITGVRLLSHDIHIQQCLIEALSKQVHNLEVSSAHVLFPSETHASVLESSGWLKRKGVQFRWENNQYLHFDDFLATLSHDKRKKIKQERKKVSAAGVTCYHLSGRDITSAHWQLFFACYQNTYREHHSSPYLNLGFFEEIGQTMPEHLLMIVAEQAGKPIAAALNIYGTDVNGISQLYGRYWGAMQFVSGLHFELCYYQAQEFCIEKGIQYFEGGAQGEHKLARGFTARPTCSFHYIADPQFRAAISRFLQREAMGMGAYVTELEQRSPFKSV